MQGCLELQGVSLPGIYRWLPLLHFERTHASLQLILLCGHLHSSKRCSAHACPRHDWRHGHDSLLQAPPCSVTWLLHCAQHQNNSVAHLSGVLVLRLQVGVQRLDQLGIPICSRLSLALAFQGLRLLLQRLLLLRLELHVLRVSALLQSAVFGSSVLPVTVIELHLTAAFTAEEMA